MRVGGGLAHVVGALLVLLDLLVVLCDGLIAVLYVLVVLFNAAIRFLDRLAMLGSLLLCWRCTLFGLMLAQVGTLLFSGLSLLFLRLDCPRPFLLCNYLILLSARCRSALLGLLLPLCSFSLFGGCVVLLCSSSLFLCQLFPLALTTLTIACLLLSLMCARLLSLLCPYPL